MGRPLFPNQTRLIEWNSTPIEHPDEDLLVEYLNNQMLTFMNKECNIEDTFMRSDLF